MTMGKALAWLAAILLGALGWRAMEPVWTQGLGVAALDRYGQPALWMTAARASLLMCCGALAFGLATHPKAGEGAAPAFVRALSIGTGATVTAMVLLLAMAGQPLRVWFLVRHARPDSPFVLGGAALMIACLYFLTGQRLGKPAGKALAIAGLGTCGGLLFIFSGNIVIPSCQDWLVLAFALSCGVFAAWTRRSGFHQGALKMRELD